MSVLDQPFRLHAEKEGIFQQTISIYGFEKSEAGIDVAQPVTVYHISYEEGQTINPLPLCRLHIMEAQSLMDDLWECGLRPSEGTGSAGALAATQKHLEDMRKLVFNKEA